MNQFKRAQVIMLPTEKVYLKGLYLKPLLNQFNETALENHNNKIYDCQPQHLYIISDDEIKEGDYFFDYYESGLPANIRKCLKIVDNKVYDGEITYYEDRKAVKKIIATTDTSLTNELYHPNLGTNVKTILPQPSQQFIEKYIEEYNKDNVIKDVLVEYTINSNNCDRDFCKHRGIISCSGILKSDLESNIMNPRRLSLNEISGTCGKRKKQLILKINPKDNTIIIKKLKESWNREEVIELLTKRDKHLEESHFPNKLKIDTWIKENL